MVDEVPLALGKVKHDNSGLRGRKDRMRRCTPRPWPGATPHHKALGHSALLATEPRRTCGILLFRQLHVARSEEGAPRGSLN